MRWHNVPIVSAVKSRLSIQSRRSDISKNSILPLLKCIKIRARGFVVVAWLFLFFDNFSVFTSYLPTQPPSNSSWPPLPLTNMRFLNPITEVLCANTHPHTSFKAPERLPVLWNLFKEDMRQATVDSGFQSQRLVCCSQQAGDIIPRSACNVSNSSPPSGLGRSPNPAQDLEWQRKDTYFSREVQFKRISFCCFGQSHASTVFPRTLGQKRNPQVTHWSQGALPSTWAQNLSLL